MGRAIVRDPQVFLFDEPLSNLDAKLRVQMRTEIKELHQRLKTTSIYVTHDQIEAMTMADKIVVMRTASSSRPATRSTLYDHPVNTFVAGFIGSPAMNMIPGTARATRRRAARRVRRRRRRCRCRTGARADDGQPVLYGIRPEHCALAPAAGCRSRSSSSSRPAPTRSSTAASTARKSPRRSRDRVDCRPGDRIALAPDLRRAHLFDAASGVAARRVSCQTGNGASSEPTTEGGMHE